MAGGARNIRDTDGKTAVKFSRKMPTMAGDWIKMRHDLADDPAVIRLAAETSCVDVDHVVGKLHRLWSWADRQSRTGRVGGVTIEWLDQYVGVNQFCKTLQKVGWLRVTHNGIAFPKFNRHMSQSAKQRALAAIRQARKRERDRHAGGDTKTSPEKRREEKRLLSIDRSIERDIESIDWKKTFGLAQRTWDEIRGYCPYSGALRGKLVRAAAMVTMGVLPESWLETVAAKFNESKPAKAVAWLGKVLAADAKVLGVDFDAYQRAIEIPNPKSGE